MRWPRSPRPKQADAGFFQHPAKRDRSGRGGSRPTIRRVEPGLDQLANRLARVYKHLRKWAVRTGTTCYRLYDKDISDQPLIVDWYDGDAVCWLFKRTKDETPEQEDAWIDGVQAAIGRGLRLSGDHVWLKRRGRQEDRQHGGQYQVLDRRSATKVVAEGPLRFELNLSDYLDTGLFLDHRPLRAVVRSESAGKDLLNLFCYTGAFSCHAAAGGARSTTSVDLSNTYLDWAARNLRLNGFEPGPTHRLIREECLVWLKAQTEPAYDLIVCDPPTFSNSTRMEGTFVVDRDHGFLIRICFRLLRPGGRLFFSTNSRSFVLDPTLADLEPEDITPHTIPDDFRNAKIHRCWTIARPE